MKILNLIFIGILLSSANAFAKPEMIVPDIDPTKLQIDLNAFDVSIEIPGAGVVVKAISYGGDIREAQGFPKGQDCYDQLTLALYFAKLNSKKVNLFFDKDAKDGDQRYFIEMVQDKSSEDKDVMSSHDVNAKSSAGNVLNSVANIINAEAPVTLGSGQ